MEDISPQCEKEHLSITNDEIHQPLIQPIDKGVIHRICSGQVVLSLAVAMKELVENSIDAGATIIGIHLVEYGSELLEVSDNGSGISEENFEALALKHYTSKIRKFDDLVNIGTLGFRGEALSSLCALSDVVISTKHSSAKFGTKLTYDKNGKITDKTTIAREQGTTVTLSNLFSTLPVRRKEFMKNLKKEFGKMCQMLNAYCLVSKGIKFTCTNIVNKSRNTIVTTDGKQTVRDNVINVFGAKQISSLVDVDMIQPDDTILTGYGIQLTPGEELPFTFELLISSVSHGSGRSTTDRQFYFINSRPCEPTKLMKLVNEIYKQFNSNQYPFVYMNVKTRNLLVDVNVTPDKRQIFFENEKILLATVKASLLEAFKVFPTMFKKENMDISQFIERSIQEPNRSKGIKRSATEGIMKKGSLLETFKKRSKTEGDTNRIEQRSIRLEADEGIVEEADKDLDLLIEIACKLSQPDNLRKKEVIVDIQDRKKVDSPKKQDCIVDVDQLELSLDVPPKRKRNRQSKTIDISLGDIKNALQNTEEDKSKDIKVKFRTEIKPGSNKSAEEELQKQISKEDFEKMEIIGQFNLGFIITRLNNDLFIIDQHATDEKYNFEQLQMNYVLDTQVLVSPKPLELTAGNEDLLIERVEVFKKNGFSFKIDEKAPCTKKIALTAIPVSRNFVFGKDDIDEMLFMLQETNNSNCRPSRVRAMFASRACRKSVMIGKPLSFADMRKLVNHMGEIEQPWNCPHGRPTMRHLINLDLIKNDD